MALDMQAKMRHWVATDGQVWFNDSALSDLGMKARSGIANGSQAVRDCAVSLESANTYFWGDNVCRLLEATAGSMPDWALLDFMLPEDGFFWFEKPLVLPLWDGQMVPLLAISWCSSSADVQGGRHFIFWEGLDTYCIPLTIFTWPFNVPRTTVYKGRAERLFVRDDDSGLDYSDAVEHSEARDDLLLRYLAAAVSFIEQRLLFVSHERPDRATRRRSPAIEHATIRVVELRRKHASHDGGVSAAREWANQWMVAGHWRNQWYPSLQRHQPKWIAAYTKGPDDKPMKPPTARVFAVVR